MDTFQAARLLTFFAVGELVMTLLYAIQTLLGMGTWLILALLSLLAVSLLTIARSFRQRARNQRRLPPADQQRKEPT